MSGHYRRSPASRHQRLMQAFAWAFVLLAVGPGCNRCVADPPGFGTVLVAVRVPATADLLGVSSLRLTADRVDVVHRTVVDDPSTERLITVLEGPETLELAGLVAGASRLVIQFLVEEGFIFQIRFVTSGLVAVVDGENVPVFLPSGEQTGLKLVPRMDELAPWPVESEGTTPIRADYDPSELLVFAPGVGVIERPTIGARLVGLSDISATIPGRIIVRFEDSATDGDVISLLAARGASIVRSVPGRRHFTLQLSAMDTVDDALSFYRMQTSVRYSGPVGIFVWQSHDDPDDLDPAQWPLEGVMAVSPAGDPIDIPAAKDAWDPAFGTEGHPSVSIAFLDSGVDLDHPDLVDNLFFNDGEIPLEEFRVGGTTTLDFNGDGVITFRELNSDDPAEQMLVASAGIVDTVPNMNHPDIGLAGIVDGFDVLLSLSNTVDEDANGLDDDLVGWNFTLTDTSPQLIHLSDDCFDLGLTENCPDDGAGHGTSIAGVAAAVTNNAKDYPDGVAGLARIVRILPLKVGGPLGTNMSPIVEAMDYVETLDTFPATPGDDLPDIVNMSFANMIIQEDTAILPDCYANLDVDVVPAAKFMDRWATTALEWQEFGSLEVLLVKAAGNCEQDLVPFEVIVPGVDAPSPTSTATANFIRVTSSDDADEAPGVAFGLGVIELVAPGTFDAFYPVLVPRFVIVTGVSQPLPNTSFGAAFTSGAAALVLASDLSIRDSPNPAASIKTRLLGRSDLVMGLDSVVISDLRLNVCKAVADSFTCPHL